MKKVIGMILVVVVLVLSLTACGKNKTNNEEQVLMNGEYVSSDEAAAMEKAEAKAAKQAAKEAEK